MRGLPTRLSGSPADLARELIGAGRGDLLEGLVAQLDRAGRRDQADLVRLHGLARPDAEPGALVRLAMYWRQRGRADLALRTCKRIALVDPGRHEALEARCLHAWWHGDTGRADRVAVAGARLWQPAATDDDAKQATLETFRTDPDYFEALPTPRAPALMGEPVSSIDRPCLLASMDAGYADRFLDRLAPLAGLPGWRLVLHLMDPGPEQLRRALSIPGVQTLREYPEADRAPPDRRLAVYTCARFLVARRLLHRGAPMVLVTDADNVVFTDPMPALDSLGPFDAALATDDREIPWFSLNVSFAAFRNTPATRRWLDLACAQIQEHLARDAGRWHLDQNAFYGALKHLEREGTAPRVVSMMPVAKRIVLVKPTL